MQKWDYRFVEVKPSVSIIDTLAQAGREGWEAWHIASLMLSGSWGHTIYFKRPRSE